MSNLGGEELGDEELGDEQLRDEELGDEQPISIVSGGQPMVETQTQ